LIQQNGYISRQLSLECRGKLKHLLVQLLQPLRKTLRSFICGEAQETVELTESLGLQVPQFHSFKTQLECMPLEFEEIPICVVCEQIAGWKE
jgi:hypothetical protein